VDAWLDHKKLQIRGTVGHGEARLARSRDIVSVVMDHLRADETIFLHPRGVDEECDDAWRSLTTESNTTSG
jgi:aminoglycoside N3'-acetyltransferase